MPIRDVILETAQGELHVRTDAGSKKDSGGRICAYFVQGCQWTEEQWQKGDHNGNAWDWCAAFSSYCVRSALGDQAPPAKLHASAPELGKHFDAQGLFIKRADILDEHDQPRADAARLPQPGDIVIWPGHAGLLVSLDLEKGVLHTIEGNTYAGTANPTTADWGVWQKSYERDKHNKHWQDLVGFCIVETVPAVEPPPAGEEAPAAEPPPAGEQA